MINDVVQRKIIYLISIVVFIFAIGISVALYWANKPSAPIPLSQNASGNIPPDISPLDKKSPSLQLEELKRRKIIDVPSIKNEALIQEYKFPKDLLGFFGSDIKNVRTKSVDFVDRKTGFTADFIVSKTSRKLLETVVFNAYPWEILYAAYSMNAAFIDLENKDYQASIGAVITPDFIASVHVILIKK